MLHSAASAAPLEGDDEENLRDGRIPPKGPLSACAPTKQKYKQESSVGLGPVACAGLTFVSLVSIAILIIAIVVLQKVGKELRITADYLGCVAGSAPDPNGNCLECPPGCSACVVSTVPSAGAYFTQCTPCATGYWFSMSTALGDRTGTCQQCTAACPPGQWALQECKATQDLVCSLPGSGLPFPLSGLSWEAVLAKANGATVNFGMWDGDAGFNAYVNSVLWTKMIQVYNITVRLYPLPDPAGTSGGVEVITRAAKAQVASPIDLIWINGNNFKNLSNNNLLYGPWAQFVPNSVLFDWSSSSINTDFGTPNDGWEMPYNVAQFVFIYNNAKVPNNSQPKTIRDLVTWIVNNPGRFAYPVLSDGTFEAAALVRLFFYEYCGPWTDFKGNFNSALYQQRVQPLWDILNYIQPYLYREYDPATNTTGPPKASKMDKLFGDGVIWMTFSYGTFEAAARVATGAWDAVTTRSYALDSKTLTNTNFVAIPKGAANLAAAVVTGNEIASMQQQFLRAQPSFFGSFQAYDPVRAGGNWSTLFNQISAIRSINTPDIASLGSRQVGELDGAYNVQITADWNIKVNYSYTGNNSLSVSG